MELQFSVIHKPGKLHANADALSRLVVHDQSTNPVTDNRNCAISLYPTVNLRQTQQEDPIICQVIQKTAGTPKHKLVTWRHDRELVTFWHQYDRLFVRDGLLYRSLKTKNKHPDPAVVVPKAIVSAILKRYPR